MAGGLAKNTGMWSLGSKTWRAPSEQERELEKRQRLLHEAEERKIKDVKHQTRNLLEARELERKMVRADNFALGAELGSRVGDLRRVRSFGSYGIAGSSEKLALESELHRARQMREIEADRLRGDRIRRESELISRSRANSAIRAQQELAAVRAAQLPIGGALGGGLGVGLGGGLGASPIMRARAHSFGGVVPPLGLAGSAYGMPLAGASAGLVRVPSIQGLSRRPSLNNLVAPGLVRRPSLNGLGSAGLVRRPSYTDLAGSARPIVNYNSYHISPTTHPLVLENPAVGLGGGYGLSPRNVGMGLGGYASPGVGVRTSPYLGARSAHVSPVGLGGLDDFAGYRNGSPRVAPLLDPLVDGGYGAEAALFTPRAPSPRHASPRMGGGIPFPQQEFVMSDQDFEPGRTVISELGTAQGFAAGGGSEEELIQVAMADLLERARASGANGVLSLSVDEDGRGGVVARGRAVVLN